MRERKEEGKRERVRDGEKERFNGKKINLHNERDMKYRIFEQYTMYIYKKNIF